MKQYLSLREQYPRFAYRGYEIEENESCLRLTYRFETVGLSEFAPVWVFPKAEGDCHRWSKDRLMQDMIFSLGMVELVSYWKIACPPTVAVEAGWLNQEIVIGDGIEKFITLSQVSNTEVKIELKEFELFINQQILKFGDIVVDKCEVKKGEGVSTFTGQQDLTFEGNAAALGTCPVTVTGTVEDGNADMTINVKVPTLQQTVKVTYSGVKQVAESGGN